MIATSAIARNGLILAGAEVLSRAAAFLVSVAVAHELGLRDLSYLGLAQTLVAFAVVAGDGGLGIMAVSRVARGEPAEEVVAQTATLQLTVSSLATLILFPVVWHQTTVGLALCLCSLPIFTAWSAIYVLQGNLQFRDMGIARALGNAMAGLVGVALAYSTDSVSTVSCSYVIGAAVTAAYANRRTRMHVLRLVFSRPKRLHWPASSRRLALYVLALHGYSACLVIIARNVGSGAHLIDAAIASRVLLVASIPAQALAASLLPTYAGDPAIRGSTLARHAGAAACVGTGISGAMILAAPPVIPILFGGDARSSVAATQIVLLQVPVAITGVVFSSFLLAGARYLTVAGMYGVGLLTQFVTAVAFAGHNSSVFMLSIVISETTIVVIGAAAAREQIRRSG